MYSMMTIFNNIIHLKVAKGVDLKCSHYLPKNRKIIK